MEKKIFTKTFQLLSLAAFIAMALACGSSEKTLEVLDGAVDGYQYSRSRYSDIQTDSAENVINTYDMAEETVPATQQSEVALL